MYHWLNFPNYYFSHEVFGLFVKLVKDGMVVPRYAVEAIDPLALQSRLTQGSILSPKGEAFKVLNFMDVYRKSDLFNLYLTHRPGYADSVLLAGAFDEIYKAAKSRK